MYLFPGHAVPVDAGGKAPRIAKVACLIHIAAFSHDAVGKGVKEQVAGVGFQPLYQMGNDKAAKAFCPVELRQKAHFPDFDIVCCDKAVPVKDFSDGLQGLCSPAQHHHAAQAALHEKAKEIFVEPWHDFGIVVAADKGNGLLLVNFPDGQQMGWSHCRRTKAPRRNWSGSHRKAGGG